VTAWMFPGQGSQRTGMALEIEGAVQLFAAAKGRIPRHLYRICTTDAHPSWAPENLQPAMFLTEVAIGRKMLECGLEPQAVIGHSLGEFPALVIAGVLDFDEALRLVVVRGKAMATVGRRSGGGMAAVIGLDPATIDQICKEEGNVWISNYNSPKQTVIAGKDKGLAAAARRCMECGAARVIKIQVPVAAHCPLMQPAREIFEEALEGVSMARPSCPVYCDADGAPHGEPAEIKALLAQAITAPVRFTDAIRRMRADGFTTFVEAGPGSVLRNLVRQIDAEAELAGVSNDEEATSLGMAIQAGPGELTSRRNPISDNQPQPAGAFS
jgi:[acyl-carrier-protein] S-malonyltransferase